MQVNAAVMFELEQTTCEFEKPTAVNDALLLKVDLVRIGGSEIFGHSRTRNDRHFF